MAQIVPLHLVIDLGQGSEYFDSVDDSVQDIQHPWPGVDFNLDLSTAPQLIQPVWVGVTADGQYAQAFPLSTPIPTMIAAGFAHVYQGTEIVLADGSVLVFSDQYNHVLSMIAACCNTQVQTAALVTKTSNRPLTPGQTYPCPTEAIFKWIAIRSNTDVRNLQYYFLIQLQSADLSITLNNFAEPGNPFPATIQSVKSWPEDFIGLVIDGITLIPNGFTPGPNELNVGAFDGGVITAISRVVDTDTTEIVSESVNEWALPNTDCFTDESQSGSDFDIFQSQFSGPFQ